MLLRDNKRYYQEQSQMVEGVCKQGTRDISLSKIPTALTLTLLTDKPVWVEQWP